MQVCAIGVEPNTSWLPRQLRRAPDGGIAVDMNLMTSAPGVYAAGDCCTLDWPGMAPHFFQMRLWTQVRVGRGGGTGGGVMGAVNRGRGGVDGWGGPGGEGAAAKRGPRMPFVPKVPRVALHSS